MSATELSRADFAFASGSDEMLAAILDQSADCIKVVSAHGTIEFMNRNGQCAMEIDDFCAVAGQKWTSLWPEEARSSIEQAMARALAGEVARFEAFCPTAKGTPRWWDVSVSPLRTPDGSVDSFVATSRDVTERVNLMALLEAAADEMRHRLRNSYAVVAGLLSAHAKGKPEQETFVSDMVGRLNGLGIAQTMKSDQRTWSLSDVVPALLHPYATPDCPIEIAPLPAQALDQAHIDALALVLGELAVNSTKHGALSAKGKVKVVGSLEQGTIVLTWSEASDRRIEGHQRDGGQGFRLMRRVLASRGGSLDVNWADDGLTVTIGLKAT